MRRCSEQINYSIIDYPLSRPFSLVWHSVIYQCIKQRLLPNDIHFSVCFHIQEKRSGTLKEQVAAIGPHLEELRQRKEERAKQFVEVKTQIAKICGEIAGSHSGDVYAREDQEMTVRRLEEYHAQLATLQKEKVLL